MSLPDDAVMEAQVAGGVRLYDATHLLPTHEHKRYRGRSPDRISRLYVHHSGADHPDRHGFQAMLDSARFVTADWGRDWPGFAYTFWGSRVADRDDDGALVVYRGNRDNVRSWHTGRLANGHGIALALEGDTTKQGLSSDQEELLEAFLPWVVQHYGLKLPYGASGHWEATRFGGKGKRSCPGDGAKAFVKRWRRQMRAPTG